jgi:hypothetical protein
MSQRRVVFVLGASTAIVAIVPPACGGNTGAVPSIVDASADAVIDHAGAAPTTASGVASGTNGAAPPGAATGTGGNGPANATGGASAPMSLLRLADWAPDAPASGFDVCILPRGARDAAWQGPLLGSGVAFPAVGRYVAVAPGTYDARVVATSASCASTFGSALQLPALAANARATVAVIGDLTPRGNDKQAEVLALADDTSGPPTQAAIRFVDATPSVSAVVFGTGTMHDLTFHALTSNVPFGSASSSPADGGLSDTDGYVLVAPSTGVTLSAHVGNGEVDLSSSTSSSLVDGGFVNGGGSNIFGAGNDAATGTNASWTAGGAYTVALVGGAFGGSPPQLVLCADDAPAQGSLSACTALAPAPSSAVAQ